jgi:hypothetical protein
MTPDGHRDAAELLAAQAGDMLGALRIEPGVGIPPRWQIGLDYARALTDLAGVHATLAGVGDTR